MILIGHSDIQKCYDFALYAWENESQSIGQFGSQEDREKNEFIADQIFGKLAELIFKYSYENRYYNVKVNLNFLHYMDPYHIDNGDVQIYINGIEFPIKIDVKGSSHIAQWLLVEEHKFINLNTRQPASDRFVLVKFSSSVPNSNQLRTDPRQILNFEQISGEIVGWANFNEFISRDGYPWFRYFKGNKPLRKFVLPPSIIGINSNNELNAYIKNSINSSEKSPYLNVSLDANVNIGLPIHWLNKNIDTILNY